MKLSNFAQNVLFRATLRMGDGDEDDGGEAVGTGNDARVALLNSIGDNADRERGDEFADVEDDGSTSQFAKPAPTEVDEEDEAAAQAEATEAARLAAEQAAAETDAPAKIVRKVNGQDLEITDELLVKAQKIAAADQYLAEASRIRNEAKGTAPAEQEITVDDDLASVARAIQMGTEEEAVAALRKLIPKGPSVDDFSRKIDERLTFNTAYAAFCTDYKDIMGDPRLRKLAEDEDAALTKAGDTRTYAERFTAIGEGLRKWKQPEAAADPLAVKEARKAAAPSVPKAAGGKHATAVEEEKEESASETIAKMAQSRGGPQWLNGAAR